MDYESPKLGVPEEVYETPILLDLEDVSAQACCDTGGSGTCAPKVGE